MARGTSVIRVHKDLDSVISTMAKNNKITKIAASRNIAMSVNMANQILPSVNRIKDKSILDFFSP